MPNLFNPNIYDKCIEIWHKIGKPQNARDSRRVIIYVALSEYVKTIEADILQEPEHIGIKTDKIIKNPNYEILETIKDEIREIDKSLRLSFWPSNNGRGR